MRSTLARMGTLAGVLTLATTSQAAIVSFHFPLEGSQETVPNNSNSAGAATLRYDTVNQTYDLDLFVVGIPLSNLAAAGANGTPVHFHRAPAGVNGPIVVDVGYFGTFVNDGLGIRLMVSDLPFGGPQGAITSDPTQNESDLFAGNLYLNVHTLDFPGGQIRGQVVPEPLTLFLLGAGGLVLFRRQRR